MCLSQLVTVGIHSVRQERGNVGPPEREPKCGLRRSVEPLDIVDSDDDRAIFSQGCQQARQRGGHRSFVGRRSSRLLEEQSHAQGAPLRRRQTADLAMHVSQKIRESRKRQLPFRLARPRLQYAVASGARPINRAAPESRLADSGLTHKRERCRPLRRLIKKRLQPTELLIPPDQIRQRTAAIAP